MSSLLITLSLPLHSIFSLIEQVFGSQCGILPSAKIASLQTNAIQPELIFKQNMSQNSTPDRIMQLGMSFWGSKTLLSAVELGLFTELAENSLDAEALAERLELHPRGARDFFDALVALGMLQRSNSQYANTSETNQFLDREKPSYIGGFLEMVNQRLYPFWGSLTEALRSGQPQNEAKTGGSFFEELYQNPERLRLFLSSMTGLSMTSAQAVTQKFWWSDFQTFIDIGTAQGALPVQVALSHPHLSGGGLDLPSVAPMFTEYVASFELSQRLHFYPSDFFQEPLPSADVIVMGHILHDWNLEEKRMLVSKAYEALPQGGALIVYGSLIDDERSQNAFGLLMSLNMLIETPGGFDYTSAECTTWMREAGFGDTYVEHLSGSDSMVVGIK